MEASHEIWCRGEPSRSASASCAAGAESLASTRVRRMLTVFRDKRPVGTLPGPFIVTYYGANRDADLQVYRAVTLVDDRVTGLRADHLRGRRQRETMVGTLTGAGFTTCPRRSRDRKLRIISVA